VLKRKLGANGQVTRYKARLVARGFEQIYGIDFDETYASVVKPPSYKVMFALMTVLGWQCHQMDVKTAFLNGVLEEEVYIEAPDGFPEAKNKVLRLRKALYGLKQSPRQWYKKLKDVLISHGWRCSNYDPSVFIHKESQLYMTVYVDDMNIFGLNQHAINETKEMLKGEFEMSDLGEVAYYLGIQIERLPNDATLMHQETYIYQLLNKYGLNDIKPRHTPLDNRVKLEKEKHQTASKEFKKRYQSMVGSLNYLMTTTRFDIAQACSRVASFNSNPNVQHMEAVEEIFAYLKGTARQGIYYSLDAPNCNRLVGYVDSDWSGCPDTLRSTTGWVFTLGGAPVAWSSKRQATPALSSCEAEYMASTEAAKEAIWLKAFITDLELPNFESAPIPLYIDNASAIRLTRNPEFYGRTKHIALRHHFIRDRVQAGEIDTRKIAGTMNPADAFTKALARPQFERCVTQLGMELLQLHDDKVEEGSQDDQESDGMA